MGIIPPKTPNIFKKYKQYGKMDRLSQEKESALNNQLNYIRNFVITSAELKYCNCCGAKMKNKICEYCGE